MKKLLTTVLLALSFAANATTYYFAASGNDANNGTSTTTPWKTLSKFNSVFASKKPGDNFLFNRGDIFYGQIIITRSGSSGLPITIGAYGTGARPIITGFTSVTAWTNLGSNIWESTGAVSTLKTCNMVAIKGVNTAMGRYPNYPNYLVWNSRSGNTSITSSSLTGTPNWTGAELAFFTTTYRVNRHPITKQSGGTLTYTSTGNTDFFETPGTYFVQNFLIENDARTLDVQNEWYYNPSTKKLRIYSTSAPTGVQMATIDTLVWTGGGSSLIRDWITFDNLSFQGSNKDAVELSASKSIKIQNCDFNYLGRNAVFGAAWGSPGYTGLRIENCTINNANNCGIDISQWFLGDTIKNNTVKNVGMLIGMGTTPPPAQMGTGIGSVSPNGVIINNAVDSTSGIGIYWNGSGTLIKNNFVNHPCIGLSYKDGGGIYTYDCPSGKVIGNIVLNSGLFSSAIYFDYGTHGIEVSANTSGNCERGIYMSNAYNMNVHNNTTYNSSQAELMMNALGVTMSNITVKNNIFVARVSTSKTIWNNTINTVTMPTPFVSDSNYFARPIDDNMTIQTYLSPTTIQRNLAGWQTLNRQDVHSKKSPKAITDVNDLRFEYNATSSSKTVSLGATYIDMKNVSYNGTITLAPYTSAVLIKTGAATSNKAPTAKAGNDVTITLPTTTVTLSGSGTDPDGSVVAYSWTKISGPASGTIISAVSATTGLTSLVQGVYKYQLKVTDNAGATGLDTVQVTVNVANKAPTAKAGSDVTITLPTTTVTISGSGTDPDGSIVAYSWTKISGPASGTIISAVSATTGLKSLVQGVYKYQLKVTDNGGATGLDTVQVTVNVAPTAKAGSDVTITLPTTTVTISGSGTDPDGSIVAYSWTKISGPASGTIISAVSATTGLKSLVQGVYKYQLKVTDNSGATGLDTVQVTVKAAAGLIALDINNVQAITPPPQEVSVKAYPNPFADLIQVNITGGISGEYKLMLVDVSGKILWTKNGIKNAGDFQQSINTSAFQRGIYFLKVIENNTSSVIKLVK